MKNKIEKNIKKTLEMLIQNYGGSQSLKCSFVIMRILEELEHFHTNICGAQIECARELMNKLKLKK
jgi:predicted SpoU family rRNA methylase